MRVLVAAILGGLVLPAASSAAFIGSPSRNIICQITPSAADCIVFSRQQEATVTSRGRVRVSAQHADVGDNRVRILRYGQSVTYGTLRCTSLSSGMRCVHRPSGHGFKVARAGISRF